MESITNSKSVLIEDTTLREGEQTPGIVFTKTQKHEIVSALIDAGITQIEIGTPIMGGQEAKTVQSLVEQYPEAVLIGWNRGIKEDIERSVSTGLKAIHIGLPSSKVHIDELYQKSESWVIDTAQSLIEFARSQGVTFISVSAEDMGRADLEFLAKYACAVHSAGATRLRLSDTIGCMRPDQVAFTIRTIKEATPIPLQLHMHNDFGLAVANVLAGIQAGAEQVHTTINGLGERAGIASLHQVVVACSVLLGRKTSVITEKLTQLSKLVSDYTGFILPHNEPVLGTHVFKHESGIHVNGMLQLETSFEPFPPSMVGRSHSYVLGKHSGTQALAYLLEESGVYITRDQARDMLPFFRELAIVLGGTIPLSVASLVAEQLAQYGNKLEIK